MIHYKTHKLIDKTWLISVSHKSLDFHHSNLIIGLFPGWSTILSHITMTLFLVFLTDHLYWDISQWSYPWMFPVWSHILRHITVTLFVIVSLLITYTETHHNDLIHSCFLAGHLYWDISMWPYLWMFPVWSPILRHITMILSLVVSCLSTYTETYHSDLILGCFLAGHLYWNISQLPYPWMCPGWSPILIYIAVTLSVFVSWLITYTGTYHSDHIFGCFQAGHLYRDISQASYCSWQFKQVNKYPSFVMRCGRLMLDKWY